MHGPHLLTALEPGGPGPQLYEISWLVPLWLGMGSLSASVMTSVADVRRTSRLCYARPEPLEDKPLLGR